MRSLIGLLWALAGAVAGFVAFAVAAALFAKVTNMTTREGAQGYFIMGLGLIGAFVGLVGGLVWFAKSAPPGQAGAFTVSGVLGIAGLIAVVAASLWAFVNLREAPLEYDGALANLELELRMKTSELPSELATRWLSIEVQTAKTRPEGIPMWSRVRQEGEHSIIPVVQGPLYRSGSRVIVVQIEGRQTEVFTPRMKRTPDPQADWSEWVAPRMVDPPYGVQPTAPLTPLLALRYRVRRYGE